MERNIIRLDGGGLFAYSWCGLSKWFVFVRHQCGYFLSDLAGSRLAIRVDTNGCPSDLHACLSGQESDGSEKTAESQWYRMEDGRAVTSFVRSL